MDSKDYAILILPGQLAFVSQINRQTHEALRQKIIINYSMKGLSRDESRDYIVSRLKLAGCSEPIFTDNDFKLIFTSTNRYRTNNTLAKMALIEGANQQTKTIDNDIVFQILNDLDRSLLKEVFLLNLHISQNTNYHVGETTVFNELPSHIRHGRYTYTLFFFDKTAVSNFLNQLYEALDYSILVARLFPHFSKDILDSAHDNYATYELLDHWDIEPFIDLNEKNKGNFKYDPPIDVNEDGVPICKGGFPMVNWGYDKERCRIKWRCPHVCLKSCNCPIFNCSESDYGRTVHTKPDWDKRIFTPTPRGSQKWKDTMKKGTSSERRNSRVREDYNLEGDKVRSKSRWFIRIIMI